MIFMIERCRLGCVQICNTSPKKNEARVSYDTFKLIFDQREAILSAITGHWGAHEINL